MTLRTPSRRLRRKPGEGLNLIPILDAVFIFIFFLLMSTNFVQIFEISSDAPIISNEQPPQEESEKLNLFLKIEKEKLVLTQSLASTEIASFKRSDTGKYPLEELHAELIKIKKDHQNERQIIIEPTFDIVYEELVSIMDSIRMVRNTDESIFIKNAETNEDIKVTQLFDQILFGNIQGDLE